MSSNHEPESQFALRIRQALDERAAALPDTTLQKLAAARQAAMRRKKAEPTRAYVEQAAVPAYAGALRFTPAGGPRRHGAVALMWRVFAPLCALLIALSSIAHWEDQQRLSDLADIDAAMLSDDLPLKAYVDHGFNAYLSHAD